MSFDFNYNAEFLLKYQVEHDLHALVFEIKGFKQMLNLLTRGKLPVNIDVRTFRFSFIPFASFDLNHMMSVLEI